MVSLLRRNWIGKTLMALVPMVPMVLVAGCSSTSVGHGATTSNSTGSKATKATRARVISPLPSVVSAPVLSVATTMGSVTYRSVGHGTPLVMIMGYSASMDAWPPTLVDGLARDHRVIIFNNAGIGGTTMLALPLSISAMADQTAAMMSALHLGKADVLGWSMGGMIAQALAISHPEDVRKLVLCATIPGNGHGVDPTGKGVAALENPSSNNATSLLDLLFPPGHASVARAYVAQITEYPRFALAPPLVDSAQLVALANWTSGKDPGGHGLRRLDVPTLVADGTDDALIPIANDRELSGVIRGAQLVLYRGAGHGFLFQDESPFLARLRVFLAS